MLGLFRKGRIDEAALDSQLDEIEAEERSLRARLEMASRTGPVQDVETLANVEALLNKRRFCGP
jgi:hypothetical protein